jgi:hypothetical protein
MARAFRKQRFGIFAPGNSKKEGIMNMGFGFVLTIVMLGMVLGLVARQTLANTENEAAEVKADVGPDANSSPHSHAM